MEIDRDPSLHVLDLLSVEASPTPGAINSLDTDDRSTAVNVLAVVPMPTLRDLMHKAKKLQSSFSDKTSRVSRHSAAIIHARSTSPNNCFQSLDVKILLYLRLGIPIAASDVNCSYCVSIQLWNWHLANGCLHKINSTESTKRLWRWLSAGALVAEEQHQCFNARTAKKMDLVFTLDNTECLVDVTTTTRPMGFFMGLVCSSRTIQERHLSCRRGTNGTSIASSWRAPSKNWSPSSLRSRQVGSLCPPALRTRVFEYSYCGQKGLS